MPYYNKLNRISYRKQVVKSEMKQAKKIESRNKEKNIISYKSQIALLTGLIISGRWLLGLTFQQTGT